MIVAVVNIKGGVGKTTTAMALASAAAQTRKPAKVLDADPTGSASAWSRTAAENGEELPFEVAPANVDSIRYLRDLPEGWTFIDCPPNGPAVDAAVERADFVVVPTQTTPADIDKTLRTVESLEKAARAYAVLVTRAMPRTTVYKACTEALRERDCSYFDAVIPERVDVKCSFGSAFEEGAMYGYDEVFRELEEACDGR